MTQRNLGGQLNMQALEALYGDAQQHKPQDRRQFTAEAIRLTRQGLTPQDIASILELTPAGVRELLRGTP